MSQNPSLCPMYLPLFLQSPSPTTHSPAPPFLFFPFPYVSSAYTSLSFSSSPLSFPALPFLPHLILTINNYSLNDKNTIVKEGMYAGNFPMDTTDPPEPVLDLARSLAHVCTGLNCTWWIRLHAWRTWTGQASTTSLYSPWPVPVWSRHINRLRCSSTEILFWQNLNSFMKAEAIPLFYTVYSM